MDLEHLIDRDNHHTAITPSGVEVIVLNAGAVITAEGTGMLMALHSRSNKGVFSHLHNLLRSGASNMMSVFYVGYGHESIGDCGSTSIFIEGCSMLAAKAIQDYLLYSGQECSTRYIDFGTQPFFCPDSNGLQEMEKFREFYVWAFPLVVAHVRSLEPMQEGEKESVYLKAVNARAFDILRGFLPAGATTNVAWHTNLRQAADRLRYLRNHPLREVREIAAALQNTLERAHPDSFGQKIYPATEQYIEDWMNDMNYHTIPVASSDPILCHDGVDHSMLAGVYRDFLKNRPTKTTLPKQIGVTGALRISHRIDFGGFRDEQRHRSVIQLMPLLDTSHGFENWYLEQLPPLVREQADILLRNFEKNLRNSEMSPIDQQYLIPMGYKVSCVISGDLPAWVYLVELRATRFVHPTFQRIAIKIADILEETYGHAGLKLHVNRQGIGRFDARRGNHDIVAK